MKAFILAAGRGTRISRYLGGRPKCTVDIGDISLIRYTVELLRSRGITDIALSLGYEAGTVQQVLEGLPVQYYINPFYDVTNSIASAWFARDFLQGDDVLMMNGDVYLEERLLDQILAEKRRPVMFADSTRKETADYKFYWENERLLKYGKELAGADVSGEYIGCGLFAASFMPAFLQRMEEMIGRQEHGVWWENVIYSMAGELAVHVADVAGSFWAEVDYIEDYERILMHRGRRDVLSR